MQAYFVNYTEFTAAFQEYCTSEFPPEYLKSLKKLRHFTAVLLNIQVLWDVKAVSTGE
jgi:hypothetical protein